MARTTVTLAEAADQLAVSSKTVRRWVASGILTGYRVGPRLIRLDAAEIDGLLAVIPAGRTAAA